MPRVEDNDLETSQRHGLLEEERSLSGCKRICYLMRWIEEMAEKWFNRWFLFLISLPIVYIIGYYSGSINNCICNGSM